MACFALFRNLFSRKRACAPLGRSPSFDRSSIKCVIVGDSNVDKSSLRTAFLSRATSLASAVPCRHLTDLVVDDQPSTLTIWDTSGLEDYDNLRRTIYAETEVVVFAYNRHFPQSLSSIHDRWLPEVQALCPHAKLLLVETNALEGKEGEETCDGWSADSSFARKVSEAEVQEAARQMKASAYFECNSPKQEGIEKVFEEATRTVMMERTKRRKMPTKTKSKFFL